MNKKPLYQTYRPLNDRPRWRSPLLILLGIFLVVVIVAAGSLMGTGPGEAFTAPESAAGEESIWVLPDTGARRESAQEMRQSLICAAEAVDCEEETIP
jgi:hypothetical protein